MVILLGSRGKPGIARGRGLETAGAGAACTLVFAPRRVWAITIGTEARTITAAKATAILEEVEASMRGRRGASVIGLSLLAGSSRRRWDRVSRVG
jgi:hypothetical protein